MDNGEQVLHQLVLRGERVSVDDQQLRSMALSERGKPLETEPDKSVLMGDDQTAHVPQLDHLHEAIEVFALVVQPTANLLNPLIRMVAALFAVLPQGSNLMDQIGHLPMARDPCIYHGLA